MIRGIAGMRLTPLKTYKDGKERHTGISGFDTVLEQTTQTQESTGTSRTQETVSTSQSQGADTSSEGTGDAVADSTAVQSQTAADVQNTSGSDSSSAATGDAASNAGDIHFKDPVTGTYVRYIDVAKDDSLDAESEKTVSAAGTSKVTETADSMKTTKYDRYFKTAADKYNVSESLLKAIARAESNFNAKSTSGAGAMGVMQLMPETAKGLGVTDAYDPEQNIMGGAKCISQKLQEFKGNVRLALAAYNAGSGAVRRNGGVPSYCKTYVNRVLSYQDAYKTASAL